MEQPEQTLEQGGQPFSVTSLAAVDPMPEDERWLIDGFLSKGSLTVLGAPPKTGKSWLTLAVALTLASGRSLIGDFRAPKKGRVLLFPAEDDPRSFRSRIDALCAPFGLKLDKLPIDILQAERLLLDNESHQRNFERVLGQVRPQLVVLDPLVRLHSGPESSAAHISTLFGYLRALQRRFQTAVLVTHHVSKSAGATTGVGASLRGSGDIHASYDHGALLRRLEDGSVTLELEHRSAPAPDPLRYRLANHRRGGVVFETLSEDEAVPESAENCETLVVQIPKAEQKPGSRQEKKSLVLAVLEALDHPISQRKLRGSLHLRNSDLGDILHELAGEGLIRRVNRNVGWVAISKETQSESQVEDELRAIP